MTPHYLYFMHQSSSKVVEQFIDTMHCNGRSSPIIFSLFSLSLKNPCIIYVCICSQTRDPLLTPPSTFEYCFLNQIIVTINTHYTRHIVLPKSNTIYRQKSPIAVVLDTSVLHMQPQLVLVKEILMLIVSKKIKLVRQSRLFVRNRTEMKSLCRTASFIQAQSNDFSLCSIYVF